MSEDFVMGIIIKNGTDVDISKLCICSYHSLDECERNCGVYKKCKTIILANKLLIDYENKRRKRNDEKVKSN